MSAAQQQDGGWSYQDIGSSYGSMTCAGLCSLAIGLYQLGNPNFAEDAGVQRGLAWLQDHFTVTTNPEDGSWHYYYLYSLERTGGFSRPIIRKPSVVSRGSFVPDPFTKPRWKLDRRRPGERPRLATSFALLFLTRATATLELKNMTTPAD